MISTINSNFAHNGRFGNLFFTGMALHFISKRNNLKSKYKDIENFQKLGIDFFLSGTNIYNPILTKPLNLTDNNFFEFVIDDSKKLNINVSILPNVWFQTKEFAKYLRDYFNQDEQKNKIISSNKFAQRYNTNNDLCIHVRLGDITKTNFIQPFEYYDIAISKIQFDSGYITSDSPEHAICKQLAQKYNLKVISYDLVETIQFMSTCKHIVLSTGTFSWLIGILGYFSNISYPKIKVVWHGDIFVFDDWTCIDY